MKVIYRLCCMIAVLGFYQNAQADTLDVYFNNQEVYSSPFDLKSTFQSRGIDIDRVQFEQVTVYAKSPNNDSYIWIRLGNRVTNQSLVSGDFSDYQSNDFGYRPYTFQINMATNAQDVWHLETLDWVKVDYVAISYSLIDVPTVEYWELNVYKWPSDGDLVSSTGHERGGLDRKWEYQYSLGYLLSEEKVDSKPLFVCKVSDADYYLSDEENCSEKTSEAVGYVYNNRRPGTEALYLCYNQSQNNYHAGTRRTNCNYVTTLGYLVTGP